MKLKPTNEQAFELAAEVASRVSIGETYGMDLAMALWSRIAPMVLEEAAKVCDSRQSDSDYPTQRPCQCAADYTPVYDGDKWVFTCRRCGEQWAPGVDGYDYKGATCAKCKAPACSHVDAEMGRLAAENQQLRRQLEESERERQRMGMLLGPAHRPGLVTQP